MQGEKNMLFTEIFTLEKIVVDLQSRNKEELFQELVDVLYDNSAIDDREMILKKLWDREQMLNTVIAPRIAFPHASLPNFGTQLGVLGISKEGLEYGPAGSEPVHIVMMVLDDKNDPASHLELLKEAVKFVRSPHFYSKLLKSQTSEEAFNHLKKLEGIYHY